MGHSWLSLASTIVLRVGLRAGIFAAPQHEK
jgi:hypothetical protein